MEKLTIIIAGSGQIGSRYLQGLAKVTVPLEIWACDISWDSLHTAKQRWLAVEHSEAHSVNFTTDFQILPKVVDLAIISATADSRPRLIQQLAKMASIRYWILEKVLAQSVEELQVIAHSIPPNTGVWVNTPMQMFPLYEQLKSKVGAGPVRAQFLDISGITCNTVHYIDYVARWNNSQVVAVNTEKLTQWVPYYNRPRFFDVAGLIDIHFSDGSWLTVSGIAHAESVDPKFSISAIRSDHEMPIWNINERGGIASSTEGEQIFAPGFILQSDLTAHVVNCIFNGQDPQLPTLAQSVAQHELFLQALINHWNKTMSTQVERLPIT